MLHKIQSSIFFDVSNLFNRYGIKIPFEYEYDLDVFNEFRRSIELRVNLQSEFDEYIKKLTSKSFKSSTLGVFNRSTIRKSDKFGNNTTHKTKSMKYGTSNTYEEREFFIGEWEFDVKIITDQYNISDLIEMIYLSNIAKSSRGISIDFTTNNEELETEPLSDVIYSYTFSDEIRASAVNSSNLRVLEFSIKVFGPVYLPFSKEGRLLDSISLSVHVLSPDKELIIENYTGDNEIFYKEWMINRDVVEKP